MVTVDVFFWGALGSELCSSQILCGEHSGFNVFPEQKPEAPVELTIYVFANLLLGYIQYY